MYPQSIYNMYFYLHVFLHFLDTEKRKCVNSLCKIEMNK